VAVSNARRREQRKRLALQRGQHQAVERGAQDGQGGVAHHPQTDAPLFRRVRSCEDAPQVARETE
jgi:hypothetical protein